MTRLPRQLIAAIVLAAGLAGCGSGAPAAGVSPSAAPAVADASPPVILPAAFELSPGSERGRSIVLRWRTSKCQVFHSADVVEAADAVTVTVREQLVGDGLCPNSHIVTHQVTLVAPLGSRALLDGAVTPGRPVA